MRHPRVVVLSAPSGGGKSTIARALLARRSDTDYSVSATTRAPRAGELDGTHYYFLTREEFERRRDEGAMVEWAEYAGNLYGTLGDELDRILAQGRHVLLDIEVEGARQLRERRSDVVSIFILPPSAQELVTRLAGRKTNSPKQLSDRIRTAIEELNEAPHYDHVLVNDDLSEAVLEVSAIIDGAAVSGPSEDLTARIAEIQAGLHAHLRRAHHASQEN